MPRKKHKVEQIIKDDQEMVGEESNKASPTKKSSKIVKFRPEKSNHLEPFENQIAQFSSPQKKASSPQKPIKKISSQQKTITQLFDCSKSQLNTTNMEAENSTQTSVENFHKS
jgi:hypothetical protein